MGEGSTRFEPKSDIDYGALAAERVGDGASPPIRNDGVLSGREPLLASKDQPVIEGRFAPPKTDYEVASVYLEEVSRIQALWCLYFFVLLVEAALERELRRAMARAGPKSPAPYPEGRKCHRPTVRRLIEVFDNLQRYTLRVGSEPPVVLRTGLGALQGTILDLVSIPRSVYDR